MFSKAFGTGQPNAGFNSFGNTQPFAQNDGSNKGLGNGNFGNSQGIYTQRPGTSLFAARQNQPSIFQSPSPLAFGRLSNGQFGLSKIFGQQQSQPSSGNVFGANNVFGQQNKTSLFSTGSSQLEKGLFGQTQLQHQSPSGLNSVSPTNSFGQVSPFGSSVPAHTGTAVKFTAISGTDSIQKGGIPTTINTKYYSITCMKEYENKSFEELRVEDYLANRKGVQENVLPTPTFNTNAGPASLFSQTSNKLIMPTMFGQTTPGFGNFNAAFTPQNKNNADNLFRQPFSPSAHDSSGTGFGTDTSAKEKLVNVQAKPFGDAQSPFQQTTAQQPGFSPSILSQSSAMSLAGSSLFKSSTQLGTGQSQGFSFSKATVATHVPFQQQKTGLTLFGQNSGTSNFNKGNTTFGQQPIAIDSNQTSGKPFGPSLTGATSFGTAPSGNAQQHAPSALFAQLEPKTNNLNLGGSTSVSNFNSLTAQTVLSTIAPPQQSTLPFQTSDSAETVLRLANSQFPFSPHLAGLTPAVKSESSAYSGKRVVTPNFWNFRERITNASPKLHVSPICKSKKSSLFDSPEDNLYENYVKKNDRRLIIKKKVRDDSIFNDSDEELLEKIKSFHENNRVKEQAEETIDEAENTTMIADVGAIEISVQDEDLNEVTVSNVLPTEQPDEDVANEIGEKHHPCGIVLERPEYFTIPPLNTIEQFKNEDGSCFIKGFTIGRIGYGSVHFPDVMDVSNLNLDEIVFFRSKEVTIYPETYPNKPPIGQGLNREAQITLDHVYPEIYGRRVTKLDELLKIGYVEKLKESCLRQGCQFLEYRVDSGSWVFKVKHFTTYGDSDVQQ